MFILMSTGGVSQHALGKGVYPKLQWAGLWTEWGVHTPLPPETATDAVGTHSTRMHSCLNHVFSVMRICGLLMNYRPGWSLLRVRKVWEKLWRVTQGISFEILLEAVTCNQVVKKPCNPLVWTSIQIKLLARMILASCNQTLKCHIRRQDSLLNFRKVW